MNGIDPAGRGSSGARYLLCRLWRKTHMIMMKPIKTRAPTTPPTIAPIGGGGFAETGNVEDMFEEVSGIELVTTEDGEVDRVPDRELVAVFGIWSSNLLMVICERPNLESF